MQVIGFTQLVVKIPNFFKVTTFHYFRKLFNIIIMAQKHRPLTSVLVKPSGPDCNLDCTYCFYLVKEKLFPESKTHPMSAEVQEEMFYYLIDKAAMLAGTTITFGTNAQTIVKTSSDGDCPRPVTV